MTVDNVIIMMAVRVIEEYDLRMTESSLNIQRKLPRFLEFFIFYDITQFFTSCFYDLNDSI